MLVVHVILNFRVNGLCLFLLLLLDKKLLSSSNYDLYTNYRNDTYGITNSSQGSRRHDLSADIQQSQRQYPSYPSGSSNLAQYYGIQQR